MPYPRTTLILPLLGLLWAAAALPAQAQTASRVADLAADSRSEDASSNPAGFFTAGGKLFFSASEPRTSRELYVTDGTAAGTELLVDSCPGACGITPSPLAEVQGVLVFSTSPVGAGGALWRSDGTRAGTYPLTDGAGRPLGLSDSKSPSFVAFGGRLYVTAYGNGGSTIWQTDGTREGTHALPDLVPGLPAPLFGPLVAAGKLYFFSSQNGLWKSDGTAAGTVKVTDLPDYPFYPTAAGDRLFFLSSSTEQLWASDGTAAGTRQVSSFPGPHPFGPYPGSSFQPSPFRVLGGRLYFVADDVLHGDEIWTSDGTPAGTRRVTDFGFATPFDTGRSRSQLARLGERLLFYAYDGLTHLKLWKTDGTPESTAPLSDITVDPLQSLAPVGGRVVFVEASPFGHTDPRLWVTDGTAAGTVPLAGCPGPCATASQLTPFSGAAYFVLGGALWRTDGNVAGGTGTRRLTDPGRIDPFDTIEPYDPIPLGALGGSVFFSGRDSAYGTELWASDGRPAGNRLVADVNRAAPGSLPGHLTASGDGLFFTACPSGQKRQLFHTTGTGTTVQLTTLGAASCVDDEFEPLAVLTAGSTTFFLRNENAYDPRLWKSDGTPAGTAQLGGFELTTYPRLAAFGGRVLFTVNDPDGAAVWASDGTPQGTGRAFVFPAGQGVVQSMTALGNEVYLAVGSSGGSRGEVWRSDGTQAGTRPLAATVVLYPRFPAFVRAGSAVFFVGSDPAAGAELWKTDGTAAGTALVRDLSPGYGDSSPSDLTEFQGALYFFARTPAAGRGLWRSDGTAGGTVLLRDFRADVFTPELTELTAFGGQLFFVADDGVHGRELWRSDGTAAGTVLVRDLRPGSDPSQPANLTAVAGRLYFTADDGVHGAELWQSDGTAGSAGTRLVQDIAPGAAPSSPGALTVAGDRLYFAADDGAAGRELWVLPLSGPAGCQARDTRLCLAGNRFQVEIAWKDFQGNTGVGHAVPLTADTGTFWFFNPANVEAVVKVLDARALNQAFWVFYGALSSVEYTLTVTDTQTGLTRRYFNPSGQLASVGDTHGFGPLGAFDAKTVTAQLGSPPLVSTRADRAAATGSCVPGEQRLCIQGGRFAVTAAWKDFSGHTGTGTAASLTGDTGYFWFFAPTNVEVILKVLDGRGLNHKFWVFYGALSNVEYTLTVTDTQTGAVRTYKNPLGQFGSIADTGAF